jgi:hypothetical protein
MKQTGVELLKIGAFLFAMRYVSAALFMGPGLKNWDSNLFKASYGYVGNGLTNWAIIFGIAGVIFIIASMKGSNNKKNDA